MEMATCITLSKTSSDEDDDDDKTRTKMAFFINYMELFERSVVMYVCINMKDEGLFIRVKRNV